MSRTPAEIYVLLKGYEADYDQCFNYTLADLIYKRVIKLQMLTTKDRRRGNASKTRLCVLRGNQFYYHKPLSHERFFLARLTKNPRLFITYLRDVHDEYEDDEYDFIRDIVSSNLGVYFESKRFSSSWEFSPLGKTFSKEVRAELGRRQTQIIENMGNRTELGMLLANLGANVFLMHKVNFRRLNRTNRLLAIPSAADPAIFLKDGNLYNFGGRVRKMEARAKTIRTRPDRDGWGSLLGF